MNLRAWLPNRRTVAAVAAAVASALAHLWWVLAAVVALAFAWWAIRLKRYPKGPCRSLSCKAGRSAGSDETQWGGCARCEKTPGGMGEEPRFGAGFFHPDLRRKQ